MKTRKILHAADIHLDSPLQKLDRYENAPVEQIRGASRRALANMTTLAIDQEVDLVVIAGDLYDGDWTDQNTGLAFVAQAARLSDAGIPLLVIRGNHDAANLMTSSLPLPSQPEIGPMFLSEKKAETRILEDLGIAVHGQSFARRSESGNMAASYPDPINGMFNLGMLHTGLEGNSMHANYAPCTPRELTDKGYHYWALGHIHLRANHGLDGGPPIVFSGNLQGRHINETGEKGCLILNVDDRDNCEFSFHACDVLRWHECVIDVSKIKHQEEVLDLFDVSIRKTLESAEDRLLVTRVRLVGQTPLATELLRNEVKLRSDLQAVAVMVAREQLWLEDLRVRVQLPKANTNQDLDGPLQSVTEVLGELRQSSDAEKTIGNELDDLIKKLPTELRNDAMFSALPVNDPEWLANLVDSAAAEVHARIQSDQ
ncbi:exonuclease SbcCD subunit D [Rhodopirellula sp. MGV]|uniref:metallophosphoesterase family protein n=1 Tax=Rhodopirellula sp. MGV TaxID=2023130 RepID=UPI000B96698D|nr:DNA repair exonuclease [Rhodopirellula sp. MGV]OYP38496.1 phosphoesterase [Rhodopirellula sp. MGV]